MITVFQGKLVVSNSSGNSHKDEIVHTKGQEHGNQDYALLGKPDKALAKQKFVISKIV